MSEHNFLASRMAVIEQRLDYTFKDKQLLALAFVHRSFYNEHRDVVPQHNERLEFLGDSVLGLIVSEYLYESLPTHPEGELSYLRSQIVDAEACAGYLQQLGLAEYVLLGRGEKMNEGRGRDTILADLFEAVIGAIYLDGGLIQTKRFFFNHFYQEILSSLKEPTRNWKAELQDFSQKKHQKPPVYKVIKETGPDHSKLFHIAVIVDGVEIAQGSGSSKKQAEQAAAAAALQMQEVHV